MPLIQTNCIQTIKNQNENFKNVSDMQLKQCIQATSKKELLNMTIKNSNIQENNDNNKEKN